jgi:hypothetical protein
MCTSNKGGAGGGGGVIDGIQAGNGGQGGVNPTTCDYGVPGGGGFVYIVEAFKRLVARTIVLTFVLGVAT